MDEPLHNIEEADLNGDISDEVEDTLKVKKKRVNDNSQVSPEKLNRLDNIRALPLKDRIFRKMDSGSLRGVVIMWIRMTLGIGILTLPFYVKQYGAITGVVMIALAAIVNFFAYTCIFDGSYLTQKKNYPDLIEALLGPTVLKVFRVTYMIDITSTVMIYCIISWNLLEYMIYFFNIGKEHWDEWIINTDKIQFNESHPVIFRIRAVFFGSMFLITIPLFLKRNLESLQKITIAYLVALFILVSIILIEVPFFRYAYKDQDIKMTWYKMPDFNWIECFLGLCISFYVQPFIFSLRGELLLPTIKRTKKIAKVSVIIETLLFCALGFLGYFALGDVYTPNIFILRKPYPGKNSYSEFTFRCAIGLFFILNSLGLAMYNPSLRDYIDPLFSMKNEKLKYIIVSLAPFLIICIIAFVYPHVIDITNFFGITIYNFNGYIIPILMRIQTLKINKEKFYKLALAYIALFLFISIGIAGLAFRFLGLIDI